MKRAGWRLARTGAGLVTAAIATPAAAELLKLESGKPVEIACETKSVVVATDAASATSGAIRLKLELAGGDGAKPSGTWTIVSVDAAHKGSLAQAQKDACAKGCPMVQAADGATQLWAPEPKALDKVAATETLLIAVLKPGTLVLRASTFRGKDIEALEEGTCRVASEP